MATATENLSVASKNSSPSEPLSAEAEELVLMVMTLRAANKYSTSMSDWQIRLAYSEHCKAQDERIKAQQLEKAATLEKSRREGVERRLRAHGIAPEGLTDEQIADKLDGIAKREAEDLRKQREQDRKEQARRDRISIIRRTKCPERHIRALDTEHGDQWRETRDAIAERASREDGFLVALLGKRGTGKTQLAVSVVDEACRQGMSCHYIKALDLFRLIRTSFTPRARGERGESEADIIDELTRYGLLVIDEAHQRGETDWEQNTLINLIDRRYDALKCTLLIANQDKGEFAAAMGASVVSRIHESGDAIMCDWESYRTK